jgi:hypothetical protein
VKYLTRLLLAGLVFVTPTVALAEDDPKPLPPSVNYCTMREVPAVAECVIFQQLVVFA